MKKLLQEMIDAGQSAELPLDMEVFNCGAACCLCGDVAIARGIGSGSYFSDELDGKSIDLFGSIDLSLSIWAGSAVERVANAKTADIFTPEELQHPHLATTHSDRKIAHDYIRLVMRKIDEATA